MNYRIYTDSRCTCLYVSAHRIAPCELPDVKPAGSDDPITKDTFFAQAAGNTWLSAFLWSIREYWASIMATSDTTPFVTAPD